MENSLKKLKDKIDLSFDETALFPCLATLIPIDANKSADAVEIFLLFH